MIWGNQWFENKNMKLNQDKYHLLKMNHKYESVWTNTSSCIFGKTVIKNSMDTALISVLTSDIWFSNSVKNQAEN